MGKQSELMRAIRSNDVTAVRRLLQQQSPRSPLSKLMGSGKKVNVNFRDSAGMTPLHVAVLQDNVELTSLLLKHGAQVDGADKRGLRVLHYAALKGGETTIEMLCLHGSAVNEPTLYDGNTALHLAAQYGHYSAVERLLYQGADQFVLNKQQRSVLDVASEFGHSSVVQLLLVCSQQVLAVTSQSRDTDRPTCLHLAARNGHAHVIRLLLQAGMDINQQTSRGSSLHEAAMFGRPDVVRLLLSWGADVTATNSYAQTPLDLVGKVTPRSNSATREIKLMLQAAASSTLATPSGGIHDNNINGSRCYSTTSLPRTAAGPRQYHDGVGGVEMLHSSLRLIHTQELTDEFRQRLYDPCFGSSRSLRHVANSNSSSSSSSIGGVHAATYCDSDCSSSTVTAASSIDFDFLDSSSRYHVTQPLVDDALYRWLSSVHLERYYQLFVDAGYDLPTVSRMTPEDLTAVGVTCPSARKRLKFEISKLDVDDGIPRFLPRGNVHLLQLLNLSDYIDCFTAQGYDSLQSVLNLSWEDLEDIGVNKLGHQKKLMLAVEKLKRISAALLRHSTSRHHSMTSQSRGSDVNDTRCQNGGTLKAARRTIPPIDNYFSTVVPISVCQSASLLPVTSQKPLGCHSDDVVTPTNERCVTSFDSAAAYRLNDADEHRKTSTPRNYFGGAHAYGGTVNVNGVCFSVYGTLPRSLIRRHAKQGQVQGQLEVQGHILPDTLSDEVSTLRRQGVPSPPKRTNSIKTDLQRPSENDLESTLTRRRREVTRVNEAASDSVSRTPTTVVRTQQDDRSWCSTAKNERPLPLDNDGSDTVEQSTTKATRRPTDSDGVVDERHEHSAGANSQSTVVLDQEFDGGTLTRRQQCTVVSDSKQAWFVTTDRTNDADAASVSSEDVVVLDQEFDGGTLTRRQKCPVVSDSEQPQSVTTDNNLQKSLDAAGVSSEDVVVLDQEFDGGTVKRRPKPLSDDNSHLTDSTTTDVGIWEDASCDGLSLNDIDNMLQGLSAELEQMLRKHSTS